MKANKTIIKGYQQYGRINHNIFDDMNRFSNTIFIPTNLRSWEIHNATDPINEINFKNNNSYYCCKEEFAKTKDQRPDP